MLVILGPKLIHFPGSVHNFQHASHVAMSTNKILSSKSNNYGVKMNPHTELACFIAALVHDVGHVGIPNGALAQEDPILATKYKSQSIAEQQSVSIAWDLLLRNDFSHIRALMFTNEAELRHFRQLLVNTLMGTDIFDEQLRLKRQARWSQVFGGEFSEDADRRATIVIEHLIQASDVSHTMQHVSPFQGVSLDLIFFHFSGMCTENGTSACSVNCTKHLLTVEARRTPDHHGTKESFGFSTTM